MKSTPHLTLAAVSLALCTSACQTEELHSDPMTDPPWDGTEFSLVEVAPSRTDTLTADGEPTNVPPFYLTLDGQDLVNEDGQRDKLQPDSGGNQAGHLFLDPVMHTLQLRKADGSGSLPKITATLQPFWAYHLVVFGDPAALQQIWLADDPALVPDGTRHLRLLNALDQGQAIQLTRCPTEGGGLPCVPFGAPIAFGELMEMDEPLATVDEVRWSIVGLDDPTAGGQLVRSMFGVLHFGPIYSLIIPLHAEGPNCAGCVVHQGS